MVTGLDYNGYQTLMATLAVTQTTDPNFISILPSMIDNAELRICQDLDLLSNQQANTTFATMPLKQAVTIPPGVFVTIEDVNILTPAGASDPNVATRVPCLPVSKEALQYMWPSVNGASVPNKVAVLGQFTLLFGPWPDQQYGIEIVGTTRPASLSASNTTTFISLYLPHIFIAASMVYISAYQRNFGRMSDDPQMATSWESYYQTMKASSTVEEARKKFEGAAWSAKSPSIAATPSRSPMPKAA